MSSAARARSIAGSGCCTRRTKSARASSAAAMSRKPPLSIPAALPAPSVLRRRLLAWYERHRRPLPWRGVRDPYRIWLSEVMLQQTRIAAATPYYRTFLGRFPTLESLAHARVADVL